MDLRFKKIEPLFIPGGPKGVVLFHTLTGNPNDMGLLARHLAKENYTVYAPVFKGHGQSSVDQLLQASPSDWWQEAVDALALLKNKGCDSVVALGLSLGGMYALAAAIHLPVQACGVFCTPIIGGVGDQVRDSFYRYIRRIYYTNHEQKAYWDLRETKEHLADVLLARINQWADKEILPYLQTLQKSVLLVQGGRDELIQPDLIFDLADALDQSDLTVKWFPQSTHVITHSVDRHAFEAVVSDFLASLNWRG